MRFYEIKELRSILYCDFMPPPQGGLHVAAMDMWPYSHGETLSTKVARQFGIILFHPEIAINQR